MVVPQLAVLRPPHRRIHVVRFSDDFSTVQLPEFYSIQHPSAFEQSLNSVLWHGLVEGRRNFLDEGYCCPNLGRFVFLLLRQATYHSVALGLTES